MYTVGCFLSAGVNFQAVDLHRSLLRAERGATGSVEWIPIFLSYSLGLGAGLQAEANYMACSRQAIAMRVP